MDDKDLKKRLTALDERLGAIEARLLPEGAAQQLADDALQIYGLSGQMAEVLAELRDLLHDAPGQLEALRKALADHDAALKVHDQASADERAEIRELMVQLRELSRKMVRGLTDLEQTIYSGVMPEKKRKVGDEERG